MEKIQATLLAINAADDERNPPETGVTDAAIKRIKNGRSYLIPASTETRGHLTTGNAKFYATAVAGIAADGAATHDVRHARSWAPDVRQTLSLDRAGFLPDAVEGTHQGHADFRVGKRVFTTLGYPDDDWGIVEADAGAAIRAGRG